MNADYSGDGTTRDWEGSNKMLQESEIASAPSDQHNVQRLQECDTIMTESTMFSKTQPTATTTSTESQVKRRDLVETPSETILNSIVEGEGTNLSNAVKSVTSSVVVKTLADPADVSRDESGAAVEQNASMDYDVDDDGGVIRCICECDDDDGFTIQCDKCLVWQHCACFGMSQSSVPDEYHCEQCDPRPVDIEFAKAHQQRRREAELKKATFERNARRQNQANAAANAAYNESVMYDASLEAAIVEGSKGRSVGNPMDGSGSISRSRKPSQQLDLTNVTFASVGDPTSASATPGASKPNRKKGSALKSGGGNRRSLAGEGQGMIAMTPRTTSMLSGSHNSMGSPSVFRGDERLDFDDNTVERLEAWQVEYTPIDSNLVIEESMTRMLATLARDYAIGTALKTERGTGNRMLAPVLGKRVKTLTNLNVAGSVSIDKSYDQEASTAQSGEVANVEEAGGLTAIGDECIPIEISTSDLSLCTQRTYVKQISEMAASSIFNSLLQINPLPSEPQRSWSANRIFNKPIMHGLFADVSIPAGCFIQEFVGEISNADSYRRDPINQYNQIGATKPSTHLFPPPLNMCIDARRYGNTSRFARFSCHPNAVLRPIILIKPNESKYEGNDSASSVYFTQSVLSGKEEMKFGLFAIADIPRTHEITLGWEWDDAHVVHILPQLVRNPMLGILDDVLSLTIVTRRGNQRALEREKRHAAVTALIEKGDFPYSGTAFSQKMNSVLTVMLSTCLCACIGSASALNGPAGTGGSSSASNTSASSNNMKRQDCAISQMLRLSQGMSLLNVFIPGSSNTTGKSNRKSKAPDFEPLVGKRRWWRPNAMPLTPRSSEGRDEFIQDVKDGFYRNLDVAFKLAPGGKVGRVDEIDFENAIAQKDIAIRMERLKREMNMEGNSEEEDGSQDSDASSILTEPLLHESGDEDDEDDILLLNDNKITIARDDKGSAILCRTALPPKKRVSGTRLKAIISGEENSDVEYKGKRKRKSENKSTLVEKSGKKSSDSKRKKKKRYNEQSSPLTSAPSELYSASEASDASEGVTSTSLKKINANREGEKTRKPTRGNREGENDSEGSRKADQKAKKKALLVRKRRKELLGEFDYEDESDVSNDAANEVNIQAIDSKESTSSPLKLQVRKTKASNLIIHSDDEGVAAVADKSMRSEDEVMLESEAVIPEAAEAIAPAPMEPPPQPIEVPKAKLSLADYKKRLAERRTTQANNQSSNNSTPLTTPGLMIQSPEKISLPNTPLTAIGAPTGFSFPTPSLPSPDVATTPTISTPRADFAPPAPRFPRPTTPPRSTSASVIPSATSRPQHVVTTLSFKETIPESLNKSSQMETFNNAFAPVNSNVETSSLTTFRSADSLLSSDARKPRSAMEDGPSVLESKEKVDNPASPSMSDVSKIHGLIGNSGADVGRPRATSLSVSATSGSQFEGATFFNPPKGPRALINNAGSPPPSSSTITNTNTSTTSTINTMTTSATLFNSTPATAPPPAPQEQRPLRVALSYEGLHIDSKITPRNASPTRPMLVSPGSSIGGGSYTSNLVGQSSLNDFANVPKGPARMRDRERERDVVREREVEERDYREPIPPPLYRDRERDRDRDRERDWGDWDWERERERERDRLEREREREADYLTGYSRDLAHLYRDYPYDNRRSRLEEEEDQMMDFATSIRQASSTPYAPRGGGRGGYQASVNRGASSAWTGRARTRGRGSRGGGPSWR